MKQITCTLELTAPVVISAITGGQNHIATLDAIPGATLLGCFAGVIINKRKLGTTAHRDPWFRDQFLRNGLRFFTAYPAIDGERSLPLPLSIEKEKGADGYLNVFSLAPEDHRAHKRKNGFCSSNGGPVIRPAKQVNFHTSRVMNPLAGKSDDGEVFTYEALAANQLFSGKIHGSEENLRMLLEYMSGVEEFHIGRSKTAQYGTARIQLGAIEEIPVPDLPKKGEPFALVLVSPVVLRDENGYNVVKSAELLGAIEREYGIRLESLPAENGQPAVIIKSRVVEHYNRAWQSKTWSEAALREGSVLMVTHDSHETDGLARLIRNGIGSARGKGLGEVTVLRMDSSWVGKLQDHTLQRKSEKPARITPAVKKMFGAVMREALESAVDQKVTADLAKWNGINPSKSLIQRIRQIAEQAETIDGLVNPIRDLRGKRAGDHLDRIKIGKENGKEKLFKLLTTPPDFSRGDWPTRFFGAAAFEQLEGLLEFVRAQTGESGLENREIRLMLIKRYWTSFLTQLNKKPVHQEGGSHE